MANSSSSSHSPLFYVCTIISSLDHAVSIPVNSWSLWLIVSGTKSLVESEFLTANLISMEITSSVFLSLTMASVFVYSPPLLVLGRFYLGSSIVGRALFQCHVCVDRYLAVIHPLIFIRYKHIRYRGACLAVLWPLVVTVGLFNHISPEYPYFIFISSALLLCSVFFIELFCYKSILKVLKQPGPGDKEEHNRKEGNKQKMRAVSIIRLAHGMLILNVSSWLVIWFLRLAGIKTFDIVGFTMSNIGSSAQAFLFLSRVGKLPCKG